MVGAGPEQGEVGAVSPGVISVKHCEPHGWLHHIAGSHLSQAERLRQEEPESFLAGNSRAACSIGEF